MTSAQIPFVADDKLDVLGNEIDTAGRLNQPGTSPPRNTRIDFDDDWTKIRPAEINVRRPPAKTESWQTAPRNIGDALMLIIS
ncbi:hypothetical protein MesoLj113a_73530 [Mesorhizobium sp. 113-1-2]|nr:hypothetical protein MesoLj113a_73530 [Mesorhizobium sp. 113-1-2]